MISKHTYNNLTWIDMFAPTQDEVTSLMEEYELHPVIAEELLSPTLKPQIDLYDRFIYLILHFPAIRHTHGEQPLQEIDFIIGKNVLITTHYDNVDALHKFEKVFETNAILKEAPVGDHAGFLFYFIIKKLYKSLVHELEYVDSELEDIEARIFEGKEKEMVIEISGRNRELIDFRKALGYHSDILHSLKTAGTTFFGESFLFYLDRILGDYKRVEHQLNGEQIFLSELRETNNSLLSTKQNEVMKTLTILAFVTFPLSLVASIFGMNTLMTPFIGYQHDFWIVMAIMIGLTVFMFAFFKYKKWL